MIHNRLSPSEAPTTANPYQDDNFIQVTTPLEWTFKWAPRWTSLYWVLKILNLYQVLYQMDHGGAIYINHTKPVRVGFEPSSSSTSDDPPAEHL